MMSGIDLMSRYMVSDVIRKEVHRMKMLIKVCCCAIILAIVLVHDVDAHTHEAEVPVKNVITYKYSSKE